LAIKLVAYLGINRIDLAAKTIKQMKNIEEDSCLVTLGQCWITLHDPKTPLQSYDNMIANLNDLSDKFGYTIKTYNLLGTVLMIKGETEKACAIFETALTENNVYELADGDAMLNANNTDLACIIYNYIKCHVTLNMHASLSTDAYR